MPPPKKLRLSKEDVCKAVWLAYRKRFEGVEAVDVVFHWNPKDGGGFLGATIEVPERRPQLRLIQGGRSGRK